jgi:23S rRNA (cytosine1962-C5)-methyltransferase
MISGTSASATRFPVRSSSTAGFVHYEPMDDAPDYRLLDIGEMRRLERFGPRIVDRPALAEGGFAARDPAAWTTADARFERDDDTGTGRWVTIDPTVEAPWAVTIGGLTFEIRLAPSGGVGCFPEQAATWGWLTSWLQSADRRRPGEPLDVLDLFAHTGGSTLAAARAGARVVHVDAGRPSLAWARRNAGLNGLGDAPIRWIADDAVAFVRRDVRRGRRYSGIILDPPSFGHGPTGQAWRLADDLPGLLEDCVELLADGPAFVVLSAHTPGFGAERLGQALADALGVEGGGKIDVDELSIPADSGRVLGLGAVARWSR